MAAKSGYSQSGPPVEALQKMEWIPIADAARMHNCTGTAIVRQIKNGALPAKMMPRPAWRDLGRRKVMHVHAPSIHPDRYARWDAQEQRYKPVAKPATKLGSFLRSRRKAKGWTLEHAATGINAPYNSMCDWELGKRTPRIGRAWMLCELYDLSPAERLAVFEALAWADNLEENYDTR